MLQHEQFRNAPHLAYDVLGLCTSASLEDVKRKYRLLARQHHPDKTKASDDQRFKDVNAAYTFINNHHVPARAPKTTFIPPIEIRLSLEDFFQDSVLEIYGHSVQIPRGTLPGSIVQSPVFKILVRARKHTLFDLDSKYNLRFHQHISLAEALIGFTTRVRHPNGSFLYITTSPHQILNEQTVYVQRGLGLVPTSDLHVSFSIIMPRKFIGENLTLYHQIVKEMFGFSVPDIVPKPTDRVVTL